jgi:chorismate synthase
MNGNKYGKWLGISGFGESHGPAIGVLLEDIRPGIEFPLADIVKELDKRRPGKDNIYESKRNESDRITILSGIIDGKTTGMPICLVVYNHDQRSGDYEALKEIFRPGHADWSWFHKFKILDWRGGGRASGRETIARVAAGAIVKKLLHPIKIQAFPVQIGSIIAGSIDTSISNKLSWYDESTYDKVVSELDMAIREGDSLGGIVEVRITNIAAGLGDPVFGKLDARLAEALISIGGIKGIEFGEGFGLAAFHGSSSNDQMNKNGFISNNCGGILAGISTGEDIIMRLVIKPTPSISLPQHTTCHQGKEQILSITGRHDTCIIFRILPVIEAMTRLALADCLSFQKMIADSERSLIDFREALDRIDEDLLLALKRRSEIVKLIAIYKKKSKSPVQDEIREKELMAELLKKADAYGLDRALIQNLWEDIIIQSKVTQEKIINDSTEYNT